MKDEVSVHLGSYTANRYEEATWKYLIYSLYSSYYSPYLKTNLCSKELSIIVFHT